MSVSYLELRPEEFRQRLARMPVAYLPLGTLEWHGEHLPLGSDALQAQGVFLRAAEAIGGIVLPPLFVGPDIREDDSDLIGMDTCPGSPMAYPRQKFVGSAYWVSTDLFTMLLESILGQLARAGFKVVVAHGHGPSTNLFARNMPTWEARFGLHLLHLWNDLGEQCLGFMVDHAAANETSIMQALHPDLVDLEAIRDQEPLLGIMGADPRKAASQEKGERILTAHVKHLRQRIGMLLDTAVP